MWLKLINCLHGLERARLTFMVRSLFVSIWEDPRFTFPFKKKGQIPALEPVQPKYRKVSKRHEGKLVPQEDLQALNLMWHSGQLALSHKQLGKQNSKAQVIHSTSGRHSCNWGRAARRKNLRYEKSNVERHGTLSSFSLERSVPASDAISRFLSNWGSDEGNWNS